jgi:Protein of unknown function (DUF3572)
MQPDSRNRITAEEAQEIAIKALAFLAGDSERLGRFLAITGLGPENLRAASAQKGFLGQVLHYLSQDESLLLAFAGENGMLPGRVSRACQALIGDTEHHELL